MSTFILTYNIIILKKNQKKKELNSFCEVREKTSTNRKDSDLLKPDFLERLSEHV